MPTTISLELTHRKLDATVYDVNDWPHDLVDEDVLEQLLALNLERAGKVVSCGGVRDHQAMRRLVAKFRLVICACNGIIAAV